jgi:hypothetical protein
LGEGAEHVDVEAFVGSHSHPKVREWLGHNPRITPPAGPG